MAQITTCDWTKKRLGKNDETFTLTIDGKEYEVCAEALAEIKARLEADEAPSATLQFPPGVRAVTPPAAPVAAAESNQDEPEALDEVPAPAQPTGPIPPITIPASIRERLPVPTISQADSVLADSKKFDEGTLRALTPGKARKAAQEKLLTKWESRFEDNKPERQLPERVRRGE